MLEVRNIAFSYSREPVLRDVSFVVSPGEVVSVVGANGAGKTTLLRILATLAVPDSGLVIADGSNAFALPIRYRRQIGYLPENPALYEDMTVKEYLSYRADLKGEPSKRVRRRVALADALLLRPRILLLDDFLAGLDREMRSAAGAILSEAAAFSSVIVTGHEIEDFAKWTTRFLVLRDGVVAATVSSAGGDAAGLVSKVSYVLDGGVGP